MKFIYNFDLQLQFDRNTKNMEFYNKYLVFVELEGHGIELMVGVHLKLET